jgi:PAS domain S-box-containing protein
MGEILQIFAARASAELERLRMMQELFIKKRAMAAATEGIVLLDVSQDHAIVYANLAMERITGYTREELMGQSLSLIEGGESDPASINELNKAITQREPCQVEILNYRKDGSSFWNEITITPVRNEFGEVTHFIGTQLDITKRRQTEEALRRSQKMEALGQMAGGIAHDFNNQLGIIIGYLDFLRGHLAGEDKPRQWVETATQSTERCIDLTRQLLSFSRRQTSEKSSTDLNRELSKMETLIARSVTPAISVQIVPGEGLWPVAINSGEFQDAILNLAINARDAMPEGGKLYIEATNKIVDAQQASVSPELSPGDYVQVTVRDSGHGMDKTLLDRVFEPFFTTKPEGKGTGLGLAMVYSFAKRYGGEIKVESDIGVGTTFQIYLPREIETPQLASASGTQPHTPLGGTETILIVDDEEDLLQLTKQYLDQLGYKTFTASNYGEAYNLLMRHTDIELLFTDVVMSGDSNGYELAEQAVKLLPGLKVLLTSGYTSNTIANVDQSRFAKHLLHKPFRQEELAGRVRTVLDEGETDYIRTKNVNTNLAGRTILVVDDDMDARDLFKLNLERLGCETIPARNGTEAIALYRNSLQNGKPIDIIILDLNLSSDMDGKSVADKIRYLDPKARLIVASGYSDGPEMSHSRDHGFLGAIEKDFDRERIEQVLTQVLI